MERPTKQTPGVSRISLDFQKSEFVEGAIEVGVTTVLAHDTLKYSAQIRQPEEQLKRLRHAGYRGALIDMYERLLFTLLLELEKHGEITDGPTDDSTTQRTNR